MASEPSSTADASGANRGLKMVWRIVQFPAIRILLALIFVGAGAALAQSLLLNAGGTWDGQPVARIIANAAGVLVVGIVYVLYVRLIERRRAAELAVHPGWTELLIGMAVGAVLIGVTILVLWLLGYYQVTGTNSPAILTRASVIGIVSAFTEEVIFRAIVYRISEEALGTWLALLVSALVFGLVHLASPGATVFTSVAIALEAGLLLAAMYTWTRRLWMSVGAHFAWNFMQGDIFGVAVSGNEAQGLLRSRLTGPELLTGDAFGAEASIIAVIVSLFAFGYYLARIIRQGKVVSPMWRRTVQTEAASEALTERKAEYARK